MSTNRWISERKLVRRWYSASRQTHWQTIISSNNYIEFGDEFKNFNSSTNLPWNLKTYKNYKEEFRNLILWWIYQLNLKILDSYREFGKKFRGLDSSTNIPTYEIFLVNLMVFKRVLNILKWPTNSSKGLKSSVSETIIDVLTWLMFDGLIDERFHW